MGSGCAPVVGARHHAPLRNGVTACATVEQVVGTARAARCLHADARRPPLAGSTSALTSGWRWPRYARWSRRLATRTSRPTSRAGTSCSPRPKGFRSMLPTSRRPSRPSWVSRAASWCAPAPELANVVADNPYPDEPNPKLVHAILLDRRSAPILAEATWRQRSNGPPHEGLATRPGSSRDATAPGRAPRWTSYSTRPPYSWPSRRGPVDGPERLLGLRDLVADRAPDSSPMPISPMLSPSRVGSTMSQASRRGAALDAIARPSRTAIVTGSSRRRGRTRRVPRPRSLRRLPRGGQRDLAAGECRDLARVAADPGPPALPAHVRSPSP